MNKFKYNYTFTVFTATYNRANSLNRVYQSLIAQTFKEFEWVIVDDGSTDNTSDLVKRWSIECQFPIQYIYQKNSGKHVAFNQGVRQARGEFFINLDSDDSCSFNALEQLKLHWDEISKDQLEKFSGVICSCQDSNHKLIGTPFPFSPIDTSLQEIRYKYKVRGDKWGFCRTDILKSFPFPETLKYYPESIIWKKIANIYVCRYVNEVLRTYWISSLSLSHGGMLGKNFLGKRLRVQAILNDDIAYFYFSPLEFIEAAINYSRYSLHSNFSIYRQFLELSSIPARILWFLLIPIGYLFYFRDLIFNYFKNKEDIDT